jgi:hypothetical protein
MGSKAIAISSLTAKSGLTDWVVLCFRAIDWYVGLCISWRSVVEWLGPVQHDWFTKDKCQVVACRLSVIHASKRPGVWDHLKRVWKSPRLQASNSVRSCDHWAWMAPITLWSSPSLTCRCLAWKQRINVGTLLWTTCEQNLQLLNLNKGIYQKAMDWN